MCSPFFPGARVLRPQAPGKGPLPPQGSPLFPGETPGARPGQFSGRLGDIPAASSGGNERSKCEAKKGVFCLIRPRCAGELRTRLPLRTLEAILGVSLDQADPACSPWGRRTSVRQLSTAYFICGLFLSSVKLSDAETGLCHPGNPH